jgi:hypothetical protein
MVPASRPTRRVRLLAATLQVAAASVFLVGTAALLAVALVDGDVLEYAERDGAALEIMRAFVRMGESAAGAPLTWYPPRIFALAVIIGLLLLAAYRVEPADRRRLPFG